MRARRRRSRISGIEGNGGTRCRSKAVQSIPRASLRPRPDGSTPWRVGPRPKTTAPRALLQAVPGVRPGTNQACRSGFPCSNDAVLVRSEASDISVTKPTRASRARPHRELAPKRKGPFEQRGSPSPSAMRRRARLRPRLARLGPFPIAPKKLPIVKNPIHGLQMGREDATQPN